ncbi:hypothetical protein EDD18DRAFT_1433039 [Armillaria luteobubalina]|uniref:Uncharacterized protein n=1 Tax=Armillaria luteobubalina TaxID=153913 RepID=A0AA39UHL8_9AGAR|nr:hypothetical protein EDD18DRAFT_1433039 [Armillaria luteobubalina]
MFDLFLLHCIILFLLEKLVYLLFAEVRVIGRENVPHDRPVVVSLFPEKQDTSVLHARVYRLLLSSGGILTQLEDVYKALATGAAVPIFSYEQKSSMNDAGSVALGYHRVRFRSPILTTSKACLSDETMNLEMLHKLIVSAQVEATINAPDQDTLFAMQAARDLLWGRVDVINIDEFVPVSQICQIMAYSQASTRPTVPMMVLSDLGLSDIFLFSGGFSHMLVKNTCLYMAALLLLSACMAQTNHCLQLLLPMLRLVLFTVQSCVRAMMALVDFFEELEKFEEGANLGTNAHLDRTFGNDNERTIGEILKCVPLQHKPINRQGTNYIHIQKTTQRILIVDRLYGGVSRFSDNFAFVRTLWPSTMGHTNVLVPDLQYTCHQWHMGQRVSTLCSGALWRCGSGSLGRWFVGVTIGWRWSLWCCFPVLFDHPGDIHTGFAEKRAMELCSKTGCDDIVTKQEIFRTSFTDLITDKLIRPFTVALIRPIVQLPFMQPVLEVWTVWMMEGLVKWDEVEQKDPEYVDRIVSAAYPRMWPGAARVPCQYTCSWWCADNAEWLATVQSLFANCDNADTRDLPDNVLWYLTVKPNDACTEGHHTNVGKSAYKAMIERQSEDQWPFLRLVVAYGLQFRL